MEERTLNALEFPRILEHLAKRCSSEAGKQAALAVRPLNDLEEVRRRQRLVEEARIWSAREQTRIPSFPDISPVFTFLEGRDPLLDTDELWALKESLGLAQNIAHSIHAGAAQLPTLEELTAKQPLPQLSLSALRRCIGDDGSLKDESSPGLLLVRSEVRALHQGCLRKTKEYAERYNIAHYLQDDYMTLASDRYVLPLKANFKGRLQGIIHDYSRTGETLYFEPLFLVEQNNRLQELKQQEREEERKVLRQLTQLLVQELPQVRAAWELIVSMDMLLGCCALMSAFEGRCVLMEEGAALHLPDALHPLLVLEKEKAVKEASDDSRRSRRGDMAPVRPARIVPLDLMFRERDRFLVISGGNAGGKTVALKTLGLITLMTLAGLPAPVGPGAVLPLWTNIHAFIGDEQSLEDHVSTFTGQIRHLAEVWDSVDDSSLILLDEFGAGTDPAQGAALAQAVLDGLLERGASGVTATHFPALKSYALTKPGVRAASVLFDPVTKKPLFRLAYDQVGASQALDVAREHGLPESVLRRAEHYLLMDGEDSEAVLTRLNELAAERERELVKLRQEEARARQKRAELQQKFEKDRAGLHDEVRRKSQELMAAWKAGKNTAKQSLKEMSRLRASLLHPQEDEEKRVCAAALETLKTGDMVRHRPWAKQAKVLELDEKSRRVKIDLNGVSMWAKLDDLEPLQSRAEVVPHPKGVLTRVSRPASFLRVDLRGQRADIALAELEQFLDRALLSGPDGVEIVHGRGTGALRKAVHQFLKNFPGVASFECAAEDQGGDGVTLVTFR